MIDDPKDVGDRTKFTFTFTDMDDELFDAPVVLVKVRTPGSSGAETTYQFGVDAAVVRESEGVYSFEQPWTSNGSWTVRALAMADIGDPTSTMVAIERSISVRKSAFSTPIV